MIRGLCKQGGGGNKIPDKGGGRGAHHTVYGVRPYNHGLSRSRNYPYTVLWGSLTEAVGVGTGMVRPSTAVYDRVLQREINKFYR